MPHRTTYVGTVLPNPMSSIFEDMGFSFLQKETSQSGISIACGYSFRVKISAPRSGSLCRSQQQAGAGASPPQAGTFALPVTPVPYWSVQPFSRRKYFLDWFYSNRI